MSYTALYNKYRSKTFDEIIGQDAIVKTLKNALANNKIAHAYLFCGPRGTGKTSLARLFAKALNCEEGVGRICNECHNCKSINEGSNPDVIEIDAASNSGVDNVRNLIEQSRYSPTQGRYKVYIIDEVHNLSKEAFNALLKTLEEPPEYVVFILCTTDPYKVLPTVLSRCQRYNLSKLSKDNLNKLLTNVLIKEGVTCDIGVLDLLIEIANGGARDALSILDQLIAYSDGHITLKSVQDMFGITNNEEKVRLLTYIANKDTVKVINFLDNLAKNNVDVSRFVTELLSLLKDALIYLKTNDPSLLEYASADVVRKVANLFDSTRILSLIDLFLECDNKIKTSSNPNFVLEIYVLKSIEEAPKIVNNQVENPAKPELNLKKSNISLNTNNDFKVNTYNKDNIEKPKQESIVETPKETEAPKVETQHEDESSTPIPSFKPLYKGNKSYFIEKDDIVKLMCIGEKYKATKKRILDDWKKIDAYLNDPELGLFANLLKEGRPYICSKKLLILSYDFKAMAIKANIVQNNDVLSKIVKDLFGIDVKIYALNREDQADFFQAYLNLKQVNKLPDVSDDENIPIKEIITE